MFPCITLSFLTINKACRNLSSTILTFTWTSRGFAEGKYTISAYAEPVPGETHTADNTYPRHPKWNPTADLNDDNLINILDIATPRGTMKDR
jgi:hypothetical protein